MQQQQQKVRPFNDVLTLEQLPYSSASLSPRPIKFLNSSSKIQNIYRSLQREQISSRTAARSIINKSSYQGYNGRKKIPSLSLKNYDLNINAYVKQLTSGLEVSQCQMHLTEEKFRMLKKIIENYDIKNLEKDSYAKLINTFGLRIGTATKNEKKYKPQTSRFLRIKPKTSLSNNYKNPRNTARDNVIKNNRVQVDELEDEIVLNPINEKKSNKIKYRISRKFHNELNRQKPFKYTSNERFLLDKVNKYRRFLFMLNYANRLYRDLEIQMYPEKLKYYVGKGNNSNLIKSLMKRRYWFEEVSSGISANFVWTQIKLQKLHKSQKNIITTKQFQLNVSKGVRLTGVGKNEPMGRILTAIDIKEYQDMLTKGELKKEEFFLDHLNHQKNKINIENIESNNCVHNHIRYNGVLGNKKALYYSLKDYCELKGKNVFELIPLTFHIRRGMQDENYKKFLEIYHDRKIKRKPNYWIIKPGQFSNRGQGISCCNKLQDIKKKVFCCKNIGKYKHTIILQQYISKPLLYNYRKFDIRVFMLLTTHNNNLKAYWYQQGYIRTSSYTYDLDSINDNYIHLTNDAIQKNSEDYCRFEPGNKISFVQFQRYLDTITTNRKKSLDFQAEIYPAMKNIGMLVVKSTYSQLAFDQRGHNFELFGLDFMIDENFKPWLLQVNTNPCLEMSCPLLERIIPHMLQNVLRLCIDPIYPPPSQVLNNYKYNIPENALHYNKFQLIFDQKEKGVQLQLLENNKIRQFDIEDMEQEKQQYQQQGKLLQLANI